ncbi:MAG TPA: hypothetical protein VGU26_00095, partial [Gaiellaceae bacterium]|nr:hypothetical protein [Gaiellaceae bacterium]
MAVRILVVGVVSLLALTFSTTARAAYNPTLLVGETSPVLGGTGSVRIFARTRAEDDATATITIYSPRGYVLQLAHPAGTVLGSVIAFLGPEAVQGSIRTSVGDPSNACAP